MAGWHVADSGDSSGYDTRTRGVSYLYRSEATVVFITGTRHLQPV